VALTALGASVVKREPVLALRPSPKREVEDELALGASASRREIDEELVLGVSAAKREPESA